MKTLSEIYVELQRSVNIPTKISYKGLSDTELKDLESNGIKHYKGKVRELVIHDDFIDIVHTDQLSAFDRYIGMVPYKGVLLADIASKWFELCSQNDIPNHFIDRPHPRVMRAEKMTPFKIEVVVRNYMAGSMARSYKKGVREFCGNLLPEDLAEFSKLDRPIITPTTKAEVFEHDEETSSEQLVSQGVCIPDEWNQIQDISLRLFELGTIEYNKIGYILVDTKYEFGKDQDGKIKVIDEVHTPDSSRLWIKSSYEKRVSEGSAPEMLDKENIRRFLIDVGFSGHGDVPEVPTPEIITLGETYLKVRNQLLKNELMIEESTVNRPII